MIAALLSTFFTAASAVGAQDLFSAAMNAYREKNNGAALENFLLFVAQNPDDPRGPEALQRVWEIAHKVRETDEALRLDPADWKAAVISAKDVVGERRRGGSGLLSDLETLSRKLPESRVPLEALRLMDIDPAAVTPENDQWAQAKMETHLATIRQTLENLLQDPFPNAADLHEVKGYYWLYQGNLGLTIEEWKESLRLSPDRKDLEKRLAGAEAAFAAETRRQKARGAVLAGIENFNAGRFETALSQFQNALRLDPNSAEARRYLKLSEETLARETRQRQIQALTAKGRKHEAAGRWLDAVQSWVDVLALQPAHKEARAALARARDHLGAAPSTEKPAPSPAARSTQKAEEAYALGLIHYTDRRLEEAEKTFLEALRWQPDLDKARRALEQVRSELAKR